VPGQPRGLERSGRRHLGLEGGVAGGNALGVDAPDRRPVGRLQRSDGHVAGEVSGAARPRGECAHDDVGRVREAGAAGLVDRHDGVLAVLANPDEADLSE
jgi:hypothetical protein